MCGSSFTMTCGDGGEGFLDSSDDAVEVEFTVVSSLSWGELSSDLPKLENINTGAEGKKWYIGFQYCFETD